MGYAFQKLGVQLYGDVFFGLTMFLLCLLACRLANEGFLFLILFLAKATSIILFAPVISAPGGALGCAIHHLLASLATSVPWLSCSSAGWCKAQLRRGSSLVGWRSGATPVPSEYCLGYNLPLWAPSSPALLRLLYGTWPGLWWSVMADIGMLSSSRGTCGY